MAAAVRRFISRYLVGDRQTTDVNENSELIYQLSRKDLWEEKYGKLDNLDQLISAKMNKFKIKVGQAFSFYEIIGIEDRNSIIIDKDKKEENIMNQQDENPANSNQVKEESDNDNDKKPKLFDPDDNNDGNDGDEGEYSEDNIRDIYN